MVNGFAINGASINGSGSQSVDIRVAVLSPLMAAAAVVFHDWSRVVPDYAVHRYTMVIDGNVLTTIPISSWQGTTHLDQSNFLQAVIPSCGEYLTLINSEIGSPFIIYRTATFDGMSITQEIIRGPLSTARMDRGATNYTCTISGYEATFTELAVSSETTRTLANLRSISTSSGGIRARADIDWFLKPGQKAIIDGSEITVGYINYIVGQGDAYMDVGE